MEAGWIRPAGRREVPGRPLTYATTAEFLSHFGLESRRDLPGIDDLRAAGLLDPVDLAFEQAEVAPEGDAPYGSRPTGGNGRNGADFGAGATPFLSQKPPPLPGCPPKAAGRCRLLGRGLGERKSVVSGKM